MSTPEDKAPEAETEAPRPGTGAARTTAPWPTTGARPLAQPRVPADQAATGLEAAEGRDVPDHHAARRRPIRLDETRARQDGKARHLHALARSQPTRRHVCTG